LDGSLLVAQLISGLTSAMTLFLVASGLTLIFGVVNVFNFAHGSFYLLGAYFAYQVVAVSGVNFWAGVLLAALGAGAAGMLMEYFFLRRIYGRAGEAGFQILLTYSFILILDDVVKMVWGTDYKSISKPEILSGPFSFGEVTMPRYDLVVIVIGLAVAFGMWAAIKKTRFGMNLRAISSNREMASSLGVNVPLIIGSLIVVVIGGLGNFWGALVGALVIGEVTAFGILFLPQWAILFSYAVMALVLIFRPEGLLMKRGAVG
jgi:branched-chain amino acid transport system permease protein